MATLRQLHPEIFHRLDQAVRAVTAEPMRIFLEGLRKAGLTD